MVKVGDQIALTSIGPAQILGVAELAFYTGGSILSVAKICLEKIGELYHRHLSKNVNKKFDLQILITAEFKVLNDRVYAIFMAIITIIPFGGIYRYGQAKNEEVIDDLLIEGDKFVEADDYTLAFKKYKEAVGRGSVEALSAICQNDSEYIKQGLITKEEMSKLLHQAAAKGDADAQEWLAGHYYNYYSKDTDYLKLPKDEAKAFKLVTQSALQENPNAMNTLGTVYGKMKTRDSQQSANYWFKKAMSKGSIHGQMNWASNLANGKGVTANKADKVEATRLYRDAFKKDIEDATDSLEQAIALKDKFSQGFIEAEAANGEQYAIDLITEEATNGKDYAIQFLITEGTNGKQYAIDFIVQAEQVNMTYALDFIFKEGAKGKKYAQDILTMRCIWNFPHIQANILGKARESDKYAIDLIKIEAIYGKDYAIQFIIDEEKKGTQYAIDLIKAEAAQNKGWAKDYMVAKAPKKKSWSLWG